MNSAAWIESGYDMGEVCPVFKKDFPLSSGKQLAKAQLSISALGVYEAKLNGARVGNFIMAPGCTSYKTRIQYQTYDIRDMLSSQNSLLVTVAPGWYSGSFTWSRKQIWGTEKALIAKLELEYSDETKEVVATDSSWLVAKSAFLCSEIYDGEIYDARIEPDFSNHAVEFAHDKAALIPQENEFVTEHERLRPVADFITPSGERVIDFGQNLTGYVEFTVTASAGEKVEFSHGEILDQNGNFFNKNLRTALEKTDYTCRDGRQSYKPSHCFMGFRYIRVEKAPADIEFTAIAVYSDMERTGFFKCSDELVNKLYENTLWGQKSNFLDIPTDCPQRDERLGWTGDAQVFCKTAAYNFNVHAFFSKWLNDLRTDQLENGSVPHVVPDVFVANYGSSAWGDAAVICPWQMYVFYGDKNLLARQFESMKKWVDYSKDPDRFHYGDWLALDVDDPENLHGASDTHFISKAYNLFSTSLLIKAGKLLSKDMSEYEKSYAVGRAALIENYPLRTQTEHVVALHFGLTDNREKTAAELAKMIEENGFRLNTGFVGTAYLMYALSENGYADTAYKLLLQDKYPSWLFEVKHGATTIWERWNGVNADGTLNEEAMTMNSYNHYAYGAVCEWLYSTAAGIRPDENLPGFEHILLCPVPNHTLSNLESSVRTKFGTVTSKWRYEGDSIIFDFDVPSSATITVGGETHEVGAGHYTYKVRA